MVVFQICSLTKIHQTVYEQKGLHEALKAHHRGDSCTLERTELMNISPGTYSCSILTPPLPSFQLSLSFLSSSWLLCFFCAQHHILQTCLLRILVNITFSGAEVCMVCSESRNSPPSSQLCWRDFLKQQKELVDCFIDANVGVTIIRFYCQLMSGVNSNRLAVHHMKPPWVTFLIKSFLSFFFNFEQNTSGHNL